MSTLHRTDPHHISMGCEASTFHPENFQRTWYKTYYNFYHQCGVACDCQPEGDRCIGEFDATT
eukprot:1990885-Amphidinium_carterae.2